MLLLALDTSGATVTAALHDGTAVLAERAVTDSRRHAELLAPTIAAVLADAGRDRTELTGIVAGVGPGPFTGLRVGIVTARVLGAALGVPVHGICSLDGLAAEAAAGGGFAGREFLVATDARRREVYWAAYRCEVAPGAAGGEPVLAAGRPLRIDGPHVTRPAEVPRDGRPVAGRGAALYPGDLGEPAGPLDVRAGVLAGLAAGALAAGAPAGADGMPGGDAVLRGLEPLYLRRPDAVPPGVRKRVLT